VRPVRRLHIRAIERAVWLRVLVVGLILAPSLGLPTPPGAMPRSSCPLRVGSPVQEEERPSEEERSGHGTAPLPAHHWRSQRPMPAGARRAGAWLPRVLPLALRRAAGVDRSADDAVHPRFPIPPAFHHWVRSQTW
jgi:hypothetical protein